MYTCICERVRESDVRAAIRRGARTEESVGDACGAGTGCGTCLDRICELIEDIEGEDRLVRVPIAA
ncbi:MAG TPA: (2Fe-2S)-binding protein [Micromonosporaceae bacterium]|jgi:bacterioferritin-associated ferredoxin|nr:(2Fe-2S)-binding protein [Micromonosporaceae bacterium]